MDELENYSEEVAEGVKEVAEKKARKARKAIAEGSPKLTGRYQKGWRVKKAYAGPRGIRLVIHNATDYHLTHLLENGYQLRGGGRAPAIPHIAPVEKEINAEYEREVKELLGT